MRLLATAVAAGILASPLAVAQEAGVRSLPYIAVQGEAKVRTNPEIARLTVLVQARAATLDAAVKAHGPRVQKAYETLSGGKLKGTTVSQGSFTASVEPQPPRQPVPEEARDRQPAFLPAVATTRFDLEIAPVDEIDAVVDALAGTGVLEVRQVSYALRDSKAEMQKARALAMRDAADQARVYAEAGGFRLVEIVAVQDGQASSFSGEQADMPRMAMAAGAPRMRSSPPATIDTSASVQVTWRIDGKVANTQP